MIDCPTGSYAVSWRPLDLWRPALDAACEAGTLCGVPGTSARRHKRAKRSLLPGRLVRCLRALDWLGYDLSNLSVLSDRHVQALARYSLHRRGIESNPLVRLRALEAAIQALAGRRLRVDPERHVECARLVLRACQEAGAVCWSAIGIDVEGVLARIEAADPYVATQLRLQRSFGLNTASVQTLMPHFADGIQELIVQNETRRYRVAIDTAEKRATLDAAKRLAPYPGATLHAPGTSASDRFSRYHAVCCAAGFSLRYTTIRPSWIRDEERLAEVLTSAVEASALAGAKATGGVAASAETRSASTVIAYAQPSLLELAS